LITAVKQQPIDDMEITTPYRVVVVVVKVTAVNNSIAVEVGV